MLDSKDDITEIRLSVGTTFNADVEFLLVACTVLLQYMKIRQEKVGMIIRKVLFSWATAS